MASEGGSAMPGRDADWKYCSPIEGMGIEPPSPYEIKNKCLEMEYKEMEAYVNQQREKWKTYGCTIMSDGWTGPTKLSIINFMVFLKGPQCFLKSVDASNYIKDHKYIYELLKTIIKEVDIGKRPSVIEDNARKITNFIYNHGWLLAQMRKYCGGDIVRPGATSCSHNAICVRAYARDEREPYSLRSWRLDVQNNTRSLGKTLKHPPHEQAENDRVAEKDHLDLLDISAEAALNSHQEIDSISAGHSSRPSAASTSASGYDGSRGGTDDGGDNGEGDIDERQHSQYPISQFTCENDFTHCTQDEDHGSRRAGPGIGAIGKPYRGRERMMEPYNEELLSGSFESMSIGTQFSDSSNEANVYPPHVMSYGQPSSSTNEEYGMSCYSPSRKMHTKFHIR
ncbi:hypothetical protein CK203_000049 [Vitis vinifera]|uniref:DUF659 domain-containing protein n=1 Tax=Vitis vinifera TaxID=29760 RepID=A0A438KPQ0_VITVI|nr:hypothetical protein CK203_000049 [Vitis vinifera]